MMMRIIQLALLVLLPCASGMAKWMTKEECGKQIRVGEVIMGSPAKASDKRKIKIYRNNGDIQLSDGAEFVPGEELLVMLYGPKDNGLQYVFEATNAGFVGGGCANNCRLANAKLAKLRVPDEPTGDITIVAGWALGYDNVKITPTITLHAPSGSPNTDQKGGNQPAATENSDSGSVAGNTGGDRSVDNRANQVPGSEPVKPAVPIKVNLRGGQAQKLEPEETKTAAQPTAPIKLAAAQPSEPGNAGTATTEAEFVKPPLVRQNGVASIDSAVEKQAAAETDAVRSDAVQGGQLASEPNQQAQEEPPKQEQQPTEDTEKGIRAPDSVAEGEAPAKAVGKAEAVEEEETVEDVDAAIEHMQDVIKLMQKKRAAKLKAASASGASKVGKSSGGESQKKAAASKKIDTQLPGIKLDLKSLAHRAAAAGKRAPFATEDAEGAEDQGDNEEEEDGQEGQENGEGEDGAEDVLGEVLSASEARMRRHGSKGMKKNSPKEKAAAGKHDRDTLRDPFGRTRQERQQMNKDRGSERRTRSSGLTVLLWMIGLGAVALTVIAVAVTFAFYLMNNADTVRAFWSRVFRRKAGQDKE